MKKNLSLFLAVIFTLFLVISIIAPSSASAKKITLNYANFPPASTFPCVQMERWKKEVEKKSNGLLNIQTFPGGTLLGAKNMLDGVIAGQSHIGCFALSYHPGRFPILEAIDLPLGWENATSASLSLLDLYKKYNPKSLKKVKILTMFTCPPANLMSVKPIRSLSDMKGLEIRAAGTGVKVLELLGASPIGMPQSDVPDALHKKVIKGMSSSLEVMKDFNYAEYCRYITMANLQVVSFAVVMNMDAWNRLPKDIQKVIEDMSYEHTKWVGDYVDSHVTEAVKWSKDKYSVEVIKFSKEDTKKIEKFLSTLSKDYIDRVSSNNIPAKAILKDVKLFKSKYEKYH